MFFGKIPNEFENQSLEFDSSIVRSDTATFKLADVRWNEYANLIIPIMNFTLL
jgi:hypothetical protein